ncbi:extracellular solute-binding protein [Spiroplasma taiwanense]|uniref:ABC transporter substrate-binding protein n=1 Tax=Spiroplasma taiwanense CT-1 TaxID=1276220 RepID=S5LU72_9MOLU|nr:extracellular solute-binding protein [Spiroplasma taiwanense]AGR41299.1 hypothetical protein STAIW_v1c06820 [Spiroplasma taiwanense CT-1]
MKRLLSLLSSATLVVSATTTIVACENDSDNKVIFMLDEWTTQTISDAYKNVIDDFNNNYNDSDVKVELQIWGDGQIMNSIQANEVLPDLYITYADVLAKYKAFAPEKVVDVKEAGYLPNDSIFTPYQETFLDEGVIAGGMYVLPVLKSFDTSSLNLRLLKEMVDIFKDPGTNYDSNGVFMKNELGIKDEKGEDIKIVSSDLFVDGQIVVSENKELYNDIAKANSVNALRKILQLNTNVAQLAKDFKNLQTKNAKNEQNEYAKAFALGIDSMDNKVYSNYANNLGEERIKVTSENKKFLYNYYNDQLYVNNQSGSESVKETVDWLEELRLIENNNNKTTGSLNSDISKLDETGTLFVSNRDTGSKIYSFNYFSQGTMLMASGSNSQSFLWWTPEANIGKTVNSDVAVKPTDILVLAQSTQKGGSHIMQQGAGFGSFKSTTEEKTNVTKEFTHFLMNKDNMAKLAIWTGYMPSNEKAYTETDYEKWISGEEEVEYYKDGQVYNRQNLIIAQIAKLLGDKDNHNFNTIESAEPGGSVRDKVFKNEIQVGMYKSDGELTMDKFWKGENTSKVSYVGATAQFNTIATDINPLKLPEFETTIENKNNIILNRKEN